MKILVNSANDRILSFVVDRYEVKLTDKAIQLPVRRQAGSSIVDRVWFPLKLVKYSEGNTITTVKIPEWLFNQKVMKGYTIR